MNNFIEKITDPNSGAVLDFIVHGVKEAPRTPTPPPKAVESAATSKSQ